MEKRKQKFVCQCLKWQPNKFEITFSILQHKPLLVCDFGKYMFRIGWVYRMPEEDLNYEET